MADSPLSPAVWDALRQLAHQDGERVAVATTLHGAREHAARDAGLEAAQARLETARRRLSDATLARRAREAEIEDLNLRARRTADRLASGKLQSDREIHAAQTELENIRASIAEAESSWIISAAEEDAAAQALPEVQAALQVEAGEAALRQAAAMRDVEAAEARLAAIDHLRREAVKAIPAEVRDRYRALYSRAAGRPFALVDAGECSHCHRSVPAAAVQMLRAHAGVPQCPHCGHLLLLMN